MSGLADFCMATLFLTLLRGFLSSSLSPLIQIPRQRAHMYARSQLLKREARVNRAYGGSMCGTCLRER